MLASRRSGKGRNRCAVASDKLFFGELDSGHRLCSHILFFVVEGKRKFKDDGADGDAQDKLV
jgi:hypothetical protein